MPRDGKIRPKGILIGGKVANGGRGRVLVRTAVGLPSGSVGAQTAGKVVEGEILTDCLDSIVRSVKDELYVRAEHDLHRARSIGGRSPNVLACARGRVSALYPGDIDQALVVGVRKRA